MSYEPVENAFSSNYSTIMDKKVGTLLSDQGKMSPLLLTCSLSKSCCFLEALPKTSALVDGVGKDSDKSENLCSIELCNDPFLHLYPPPPKQTNKHYSPVRPQHNYKCIRLNQFLKFQLKNGKKNNFSVLSAFFKNLFCPMKLNEMLMLML